MQYQSFYGNSSEFMAVSGQDREGSCNYPKATSTQTQLVLVWIGTRIMLSCHCYQCGGRRITYCMLTQQRNVACDTGISVSVGNAVRITDDHVLTTLPIWPHFAGQETAMKRHQGVWWGSMKEVRE
jgi:hypothetical protein